MNYAVQLDFFIYEDVIRTDEEAEMLYHTILNWKEKSEMYDDLEK